MIDIPWGNVLTAAATVCGVVIANYWTSRTGRGAKLLELRLAAYRELIPLIWDALHASRQAADRIDTVVGDKRGLDGVVDAVDAAKAATRLVLRRLNSDLTLLAPDSFLTDWSQTKGEFRLGSLKKDDLLNNAALLQQLMSLLSQAMRKDIKQRVGAKIWN